MSDQEAQLRVVWVGGVVMSVELAIRVVLAFVLAVKLLRNIGNDFDNVFSQDTFKVVSTGFKANLLFSDAILAFV